MRRSALAKVWFLALCAGLLLQAGGASAHHSFAVYDDNDVVTVTGTVAKVEWVNPHAFFFLDVKDDKGSVSQWRFELHSNTTMLRMGWSRSNFKPGDVVTVSGARSRGVKLRAFARTAKFPDGRVLTTDMTPQ